jgi:hypothetical protein
MENEGNPISLTGCDKTNDLAQVNVHIGSNVEEVSWMRLSVSTQKPFMKNREENESSFVQCEPFSKQWKSLKCSTLEELESVLAA